MDFNKKDRDLILQALCQLYYELGRQLDTAKGREPVSEVRRLISDREQVDNLIRRLPPAV